jgi:hypothetical protein
MEQCGIFVCGGRYWLGQVDRVNVHEDYEVKYWCGKYGCTPEQLKAAVKKVGVMAKDVEKELKGK